LISIFKAECDISSSRALDSYTVLYSTNNCTAFVSDAETEPDGKQMDVMIELKRSIVPGADRSID